MELGISSQDMIRHKQASVSHLFYGLDKGTYGARVCGDLRLRENSSYVHGASPLLTTFCGQPTSATGNPSICIIFKALVVEQGPGRKR